MTFFPLLSSLPTFKKHLIIQYLLFLKKISSSIQVQFTYHKTYLCKLVVFSKIMRFCNFHHSSDTKHLHHLKMFPHDTVGNLYSSFRPGDHWFSLYVDLLFSRYCLWTESYDMWSSVLDVSHFLHSPFCVGLYKTKHLCGAGIETEAYFNWFLGDWKAWRLSTSALVEALGCVSVWQVTSQGESSASSSSGIKRSMGRDEQREWPRELAS